MEDGAGHPDDASTSPLSLDAVAHDERQQLGGIAKLTPRRLGGDVQRCRVVGVIPDVEFG
ncbi:hypothetical protein [Sorangium sp. So ce388]|uniref:hypothetical protein n=1 Tax=Sorangium sp. So ce388 TaxID=3133309 RepID=UPI003F5C915C